MVSSKAKNHFRQYICNKPTKWGIKYWVISDHASCTIDFDLKYWVISDHTSCTIDFDLYSGASGSLQ